MIINFDTGFIPVPVSGVTEERVLELIAESGAPILVQYEDITSGQCIDIYNSPEKYNIQYGEKIYKYSYKTGSAASYFYMELVELDDEPFFAYEKNEIAIFSNGNKQKFEKRDLVYTKEGADNTFVGSEYVDERMVKLVSVDEVLSSTTLAQDVYNHPERYLIRRDLHGLYNGEYFTPQKEGRFISNGISWYGDLYGDFEYNVGTLEITSGGTATMNEEQGYVCKPQLIHWFSREIYDAEKVFLNPEFYMISYNEITEEELGDIHTYKGVIMGIGSVLQKQYWESNHFSVEDNKLKIMTSRITLSANGTWDREITVNAEIPL